MINDLEKNKDLNKKDIKNQLLDDEFIDRTDNYDDIIDDIIDDIEDKSIYDNDIDIDEIDVDKNCIDNSISFDDSESELDVYFKYGTNNHKLDGKHSLKRDTIFNGKIDDNNTETNDFSMIEYDNSYDIGSIEKGSVFEEDSRLFEDMRIKKKLSEDVYNLLKNNTDLDFKSNRRKPNKTTFNNYFKMLLNNIDSQYTKSEIFVELSYYFTDNIFNMYKLLDKKYATIIIMELREKGHLSKIKFINFSQISDNSNSNI